MVQAALDQAVSDLEGAGIPLDAPLRDFQYEKRGDEKIPIHGGPGTVGVFNAINVTWNPQEGYTERAARLELRAGRRAAQGSLREGAHDPHLLAVDVAGVALVRRPDADVLQEAVGEAALLSCADAQGEVRVTPRLRRRRAAPIAAAVTEGYRIPISELSPTMKR